jgi:UDP-2,3-diacylglucosamine pyrophosphatase LpxH
MYLVISDIHLGSPLFTHDCKVKELFTSGKYEGIIINGDLLDVWEHKLEKLIMLQSVMIDIIKTVSKTVPITIIKGNHDPDIQTLQTIFRDCNVVDTYEVNRIKFMHGDQFDKLILNYSWLARIFDKLQWVLERVGLNMYTWLREFTHSIAVKRNKTYYNDLVLEVENSIFNMYGKQYDLIFVGHTHLPKLVSKIVDNSRTVIYANSGDWTYHNTYIEFDDISVFVRNWDGSVLYAKSL